MMKKLIMYSILAMICSVQSYGQIGGKAKNLISKKSNGKEDKGVGVEVKDDEKGISGNYYVWHPSSVTNSWFKKISQVAIQYEPTSGKLTLCASKKESVSYYTDSYIKKYKLEDQCGEYAFSNNYNAPDLWTTEAGIFLQKSDATTNLNTCKASMQSLDSKSFIMSQDKAFIESMTEEKYQEYILAKRSESCSCLQEVKAGAKPLPARKMRDTDVEAEALKVIKKRAAQQGWADEITGIYIASKDWSGLDTWVSSTGDRETAKRVNVVILMQVEGKCKWQRAVVAKDAAGAYQNTNGDLETKVKWGLSLVGIVPENNPAKCETVEAIMK